MAAFREVDSKQDFPALEEGVLERWRAREVFRRSIESRASAPVWSFYEGPPTANGKPGSHHVLARVFKDVYPRYRTMRGYRVPRKAGWDCHGLPVELEIERELGISSKDEIEAFGIAEFNERCRESVFRYVEEWNRLTERIAFWIDLDDPYVTMTNDYIESVWWSLRKIWDDERLYRGHKVVPYCPRCGTALSSHEVALGYQDVEDPSIYVRFPLTDADESMLVWTTTPWTLPGNEAVAVAPDVTYVRARVGEETLIVADALAERVLGEQAEVIDRFPGSDLVGRSYRGPVFALTDRDPGEFPVIGAGFVTTDDGTGLVHLAPAFGEDDYQALTADATRLYNPVKPNGTFDDRVVGFEGRFVKDPEVTEALIASLRERGLLFRSQIYQHAYPHCWRCDTPLLYYAKSSWYVKTTEVAGRMLAENAEIGWHPEHIRTGRFGKWLEGNQDWALSRERYWGTPLPIWECSTAGCEERFCAGSTTDLRDRGGEVPDDLHRPYIDAVELKCEGCGGVMRRVIETIDAWFDSGSMPFAQYHYPFEGSDLFAERFPADFISEGIDQTRGWFYSLLAVSTLLFDTTSYRNCVCLGLIADPDGQKMSKSKGNVVDPWEVIDRYGADAFRWFYLTAQQPWAGYRFSVDTLGESVHSFFNTLWNTYRICVMYANAEGIAPAELEGAGPASELDRWALSRLQATTAEVTERMDDFDCTSAGRAITAYVDELSNWYVRRSRRRLWEGDPAALGTLRHCLLEIAGLIAPFVPFLAEEIHSNLAGGAAGEFGARPDSVHLRDFPEPDAGLRDPELEEAMAAVRLTVELGHAARAQSRQKVRQPLRRAVIVANDAERAAISAHAGLVTEELNVKDLDFVESESDLVTYEVKPNYRTLGPRFGKDMPLLAAAVAALDASHVARTLSAGGQVGVNVGGAEHVLDAENLQLSLTPLEGYQVEADAGHAVALELEVDEELRREGLAREIVHAVQNARREAGLKVSDRIALTFGGDSELVEAAREHEAYVAGETLATSVTYDGVEGGTEAAIEGLTLRIGLGRV